MAWISQTEHGSRILSAQQGTVFVEFLLVFPPLLILFLCILQLFLSYLVRVGVHHAASAGVRSAVVVLPDDPAFYGGQPPYRFVRGSGGCPGPSRSSRRTLITTLQGGSGCKDGARLRSVRSAVNMAMIPFAHASLSNGSSIMAQSNDFERIFRSILHIRGATSVSFPKTATDIQVYEKNERFPRQGLVHVRVMHLFPCTIPVARLLVCSSRFALGLEGSGLGMKDKRRRANEFHQGVGSRAALSAVLASTDRFLVVSAEASLPMQGAQYRYPSEPIL